MRNKQLRLYKNFSIIVLGMLLLLVTVLAFITYQQHDLPATGILAFAIQQHTWIMMSMVLLSVAFGFIYSSVLYGEVQTRTQETDDVSKLLFKMLSVDEQKIINVVLSQKECTQAQLSKIQGMNRVKVFRNLKRLTQKGIIKISANGKSRQLSINPVIKTIYKKDDYLNEGTINNK